MRNLLIGMAVAGVLFVGSTNPAESRSDVYVCTTENNDGDLRFDHYIDEDSIYKRKEGNSIIIDVDEYYVINGITPRKCHYQFTNHLKTGRITYSINNSSWRLLDGMCKDLDGMIYKFIVDNY